MQASAREIGRPFVTHPYDKTFGDLLVHVLPLDRLLAVLRMQGL
jgi:hypothetical protein